MMALKRKDPGPTITDLSRDIQQWIEDLLSNQLSNVTPKKGEGTNFQAEKVDENDKELNVVSRLRAYLESEVSHMNREISDVTRATAALDETSEAWLRAGVGSLLSALDEDALVEVQHLVRACAALEVNPNVAGQHFGRIAAVTRVFDDASIADTRHASRNATLSRAHTALRSAAKQLQSARRVARLTDQEVASRVDSATRDTDRADLMAVKAKQYDDATEILAERIRSTGLSTNATHDVVAADAKCLTEMEEQLADINHTLEFYHDLPADTEKCRDMIDDLQKQVEAADADIEAALSSMVNKK